MWLKSFSTISLNPSHFCYILDINACDRGELAVGVVNYQEGRYQQACQCIYKFLENRSDVTFIGDPMPCDLSEVCHDLLEDSAMSLQT